MGNVRIEDEACTDGVELKKRVAAAAQVKRVVLSREVA